MVITIVKYILIFGGLGVMVLGFVKDIDLLTFAGLFLVVAPLMVGGFVIKLINRNKKINQNRVTEVQFGICQSRKIWTQLFYNWGKFYSGKIKTFSTSVGFEHLQAFQSQN